MTLAAIVGGTASKLGGGKFANGAVSGAFVHMYNYGGHNDPRLNGKGVPSAMGGDADKNSALNLKAGVTGLVHIGVVGYHAHKDNTGSLTQCLRIGPGLFIGGGGEVISSFETSTDAYSGGIGLGFDVGISVFEGGGSVTYNNNSIDFSAAWKGIGIGGLSVGFDLCGIK